MPGPGPQDGADEPLGRRLLHHAVVLTRRDGPESVSLREVQRLAGVSNSAAYRHYDNLAALQEAVSDHASRALENALREAVSRTATTGDAGAVARTRLRAIGEAYVRFALDEPGLFHALFTAHHGLAGDSSAPSRGKDHDSGPFQVVREQVDALVSAGRLSEHLRPHTDTSAWAAVHGLAVLLLDGPLNALPSREKDAALDRLLDVVLDGIR